MKKITIIVLLSITLAFNSNAQDHDKTDKLEQEILELKLRVSNLESLVDKQGRNHESLSTADGWKSLVNWRRISTGMNPSEVRKILGEPYRVNGGVMATWEYQNNGRIVFFNENVHHWMEPRN